MIVLALDSALDALGGALIEDGRVLTCAQERMQRGQAERVAPFVQALAGQAGVPFAKIDRIIVTTGPGSFTGVRVGLAFARGLALSLAKPCIGVSTLETLALEEGSEGLRGGLIETPGALYVALYRDGAALLAPRRCERGEVSEVFAAETQGASFSLRGPGALAWEARIAGARAVERFAPDPVALARLGAGRDPAAHPPAPTYLRAALA